MTDAATSIRFNVKRDTYAVEFSSTGLDADNTKKVVDAFNQLALSAESVERPSEDLSETLLNFFPKEEALPDHPENAKYQDTGIKYKRDRHDKEKWIKTYRTRYKCTNKMCNNRGNHYIPEGIEMVRCHNCREELQVRPSTPEGFPNKDVYNNFFLAGEE